MVITWEWVAGALVAGFTLGCMFGTRFGVRPLAEDTTERNGDG